MLLGLLRLEELGLRLELLLLGSPAGGGIVGELCRWKRLGRGLRGHGGGHCCVRGCGLAG